MLGLRRKQPARSATLGPLGRVSFSPFQFSPGASLAGVARDYQNRTYCGSLAVSNRSVIGMPPADRALVLSLFAAMLDRAATRSSLVHRLGWRIQTVRGEPIDVERMVADIRLESGLSSSASPNRDIVLRRTAEATEQVVHHLTSLSVALNERTHKQRSKRGSSPYELLLDALEETFDSATSRGIAHAQIFGFNELVILNRLAIDPVAALPYWQRWVAGHGDDSQLVDEQFAWPPFADFRPTDHCLIGRTYHVGLFLANFSRSGVDPDVLWEIVRLPFEKTVTTVFQMVPHDVAARRARWTVNTDEGRRLRDVRTSAEELVRHEHSADTEMRLARREGEQGRARVYIDVTAPTLETAIAHAEQVIRTARDIDIRAELLTGRHIEAVSAAMPLARGLQSLR